MIRQKEQSLKTQVLVAVGILGISFLPPSLMMLIMMGSFSLCFWASFIANGNKKKQNKGLVTNDYSYNEH